MRISRFARTVLHWGVVLNFVAEMAYAGVMLGVTTRTGSYGLQFGIAAAALLLYLAARRWLPRLAARRVPASSLTAARLTGQHAAIA